MRRLLIPVLLLCVLATQYAHAHDHRPPRAVLRTESSTQEGREVSASWTTRQGSNCAGGVSDGIRTFPDAVPAPVGDTTLTIRIWKERPPKSFGLKGWRMTGPDGQAVGDAEDIDFDRRAVVRHGKRVATDIVFDAVLVGDYYIEAIGRWPDTEGCRTTQEVVWTFHVAAP